MKTKNETAAEYAERLYKRNIAGLEEKPTWVGYIVEFAKFAAHDKRDEKRVILRETLKLKREVIAKLQNQNHEQFKKETKVCRRCNAEKAVGLFAERKDKRSGLKYYNNWCRECQTIHNTSDETKKRRRAQYAISETAKLKARARYEKFKSKKPQHEISEN